MEDRERPSRPLEARGVELERRRRLRGDHRRRARQLDHDAHLADDLARPEMREHDPLRVGPPLPLDAHQALEDEVDRRRRLALPHERVADVEHAHLPEADEEHERTLIERGEVRARAEGLEDLGLVQLCGDGPTSVSVARSRSLNSRATTRWRIGYAFATRSKFGASSSSDSVGTSAVTVAERGMSMTTPISPTTAPASRSASLSGRSSVRRDRSARTFPLRRKWIELEGSPWRMSTSPVLYSRRWPSRTRNMRAVGSRSVRSGLFANVARTSSSFIANEGSPTSRS